MRRWTSLRAVRTGSQILSRRKQAICEIKDRLGSAGEDIVGSGGGLRRSLHGMMVGEYKMSAMRDRGFGER